MAESKTDNLITVGKFAKLYIGEKGKKVSRTQIYNLIESGKLKAIKIGEILFIDKKELKK